VAASRIGSGVVVAVAVFSFALASSASSSPSRNLEQHRHPMAKHGGRHRKRHDRRHHSKHRKSGAAFHGSSGSSSPQSDPQSVPATNSPLPESYTVPCAAPQTPSDMPAGDGWAVASVHIDGGPADSGPVCSGGTVVVSDSTGNPIASATVPQGQSYAFVLPAGSYSISSQSSYGSSPPRSFTIVAGQESTAEVVLDAP
jgi:Ni/Co efflux regulator RcnB